MSVWGVSVVRDEADIIGSTLERMRGEVDYIAIADHGSTDGTREIAASFADEVTDANERDYQAPALNALVGKAIDAGAEWVVPFDADERWLSPWGPLREVLPGIPETILIALWYDQVPTNMDGTSGDYLADMRWRQRRPHGMPKVACRTTARVYFGEGQHQFSYPAPQAIGLEVRHFPYRSPEQIERKCRNHLSITGMQGRSLASVPHLVQLAERIKARGAKGAFAEIRRKNPAGHADLIEDPCP